ncbi:GNAT family N-acetyltransferase [Streptosporangium sp. NPDC051023]|uniref:GNAT family N-acetyltransferase n=1 Tax=Streptosporangium sp. NPDC051023 TaxID=3155410 RepID=UPI00344D221E
MHSNTASPVTARPLMLRSATADDLQEVLALLAETADWLNGRGVRQWPAGGFPAERIAPLIEMGDMYLLTGREGVVATIALDGHADPEFWGARDLPGSALYVHKLSVARGQSGLGLGQALLDWAGLRVLAMGRRWLRLDCSKDNARLQDYYRGQRFTHLRTVDLPHRASGALFQRAGGLRGGAFGTALPFVDRRDLSAERGGPLSGRDGRRAERHGSPVGSRESSVAEHV